MKIVNNTKQGKNLIFKKTKQGKIVPTQFFFLKKKTTKNIKSNGQVDTRPAPPNSKTRQITHIITEFRV